MDRKASRRYSNVKREFRSEGNVVINVKKLFQWFTVEKIRNEYLASARHTKQLRQKHRQFLYIISYNRLQ